MVLQSGLHAAFRIVKKGIEISCVHESTGSCEVLLLNHKIVCGYIRARAQNCPAKCWMQHMLGMSLGYVNTNMRVIKIYST